MEDVEWCSGVVGSWPPGVLVLGSVGRDSGAGQCQLLPFFSLGPPGMNYRVFCRWLVFVLGLEVSGRG